MASAKKPDLTALTLTELRELKGEIAALITEKEKAARAELAAAFEKQAQEAGIPIADILPLFPNAPIQVHHVEKPKGRNAGKRGTVAPKYRNPADPTQAWSGRGRQPAWVQAHIAGGGTLEGIAITPTPTQAD